MPERKTPSSPAGGGRHPAVGVLATELQDVKQTLGDLTSRLTAVAEVVNDTADTVNGHGELLASHTAQIVALNELGTTINGLVAAVAALSAPGGGRAGGGGGAASEESPKPVAWSWLTMDAATREQRLAELADWVTEVLQVEYADYTVNIIRTCWPEHRAVVWELSSLYVEWQAAFVHEERGSRDAMDWLDRWLPGVLSRIKDVLHQCSHGRGPSVPGEGWQPQTDPSAAMPVFDNPATEQAFGLLRHTAWNRPWNPQQRTAAASLAANPTVPPMLQKLLRDIGDAHDAGYGDFEGFIPYIRANVPGVAN
ncbi:hypothetical protein GCM10027589_04630 [Actinocorallia lasiicapitis]